jgi:VWFA-related protein
MTQSLRSVGFRAAASGWIAAAVLLGATAFVSAQGTARKVYVSAVDKSGAPVKDLTAADFEVKENGKAQTATVQPATSPLRLVLVVADGGTGAYQKATADLLNALGNKAEVKIVAVPERPETLTDFTTNSADLQAAVQRLGRQSAGRKSTQVMEALLEATKNLGAEDKRPVIVLMRAGGEASSTLQADTLRDAMRKAGARFYVISPAGANSMAIMKSTSDRDQQNANQETSDQYAQLNQVLDDGSKETGGRHEQTAAAGIGAVIAQIAAELQNEYEITYTLPAGTKPGDKLQVTTKRKDVKIYAPSRLAN